MDNQPTTCPDGYTLINGECVKDVTPPPPKFQLTEDEISNED